MAIVLLLSPQLCVCYLLLSRFCLFQSGLHQARSAYSPVTIAPGMSRMQLCDYGFVSSEDRPGVTSSYLRTVQSLVSFLGWFCESESPSPLTSGSLLRTELLWHVQTTLAASPQSPRGCCAWILPDCFPLLWVQPLGSTSQSQGIWECGVWSDEWL